MQTHKYAYLTIDDVPSPKIRKKLNFLIEHDIPAILFCLGKNIERYPHEISYAIQNGFLIGNHSYSHPYFSDISLDECLSEIQQTHDLINDIYDELGIIDYPLLFRFPFLDKGGLTRNDDLSQYSEEGIIRKNQIQQMLRNLNYQLPEFQGVNYEYLDKWSAFQDIDCFVTYDVMEYSLHLDPPLFGIDSLQKVYERMDEDLPHNGRGLNCTTSADIILIHDHPQSDTLFIPIIERFLSKNIHFILPKFKQLS